MQTTAPSHSSLTLLEELPQILATARVPGTVISLVEEGQPVATHAFGVRDTATQAPMTPTTLCAAASLSKPVFAYAVGELVAAGGLDWDIPLHTYLPLPEAEAAPCLTQITARHALSHRSGLPNWRFETTDSLDCAFAPGTDFSYSGEGYFYLQRVVEERTGRAIEAYLQENVLQPLGMECSTYLWSAECEAECARGHATVDQPREPWNAWQGRRLLELAAQQQRPLAEWRFAELVAALPQLHPSLAPLPNNLVPNVAGSLLTTGPDFARFVAALLARRTDPMLEPEVVLTPHLSWCRGWGLEHHAPQPYLWHWGYNGTFENFVLVDRERRAAVIVLTNGSRGLRVCEWVVRRLWGHASAAFLWI